MADISQLEINNTTYDICDATARDSLSQLETAFSEYCPFPVGGLFLTFESSNPSTLWPGTTWTQLAAGTFLTASGTDYTLRATGGAASVTLTSAQSGVPAHSHGLNSHTHTLSSHTHTYDKVKTPTGSTTLTIEQIPSHSHTEMRRNNSGSGSEYGALSENGKYKMENGYIGWTGGGKGHTHTTSTTSTDSGSPSTNTSGAASGSTASNTAANATSAHENRPPYIAIAMWERIS